MNVNIDKMCINANMKGMPILRRFEKTESLRKT
jgi:hypothetical protein